MDYYKEIKNKLIKSELYNRVKEYSKNRNDFYTYYQIGKILQEACDINGNQIIDEYTNKLSKDLELEYKKYNLKYMLHFYRLYKDIPEEYGLIKTYKTIYTNNNYIYNATKKLLKLKKYKS